MKRGADLGLRTRGYKDIGSGVNAEGGRFLRGPPNIFAWLFGVVKFIIPWVIFVALVAFIYFGFSGGLFGSFAKEAEVGLEETEAGRGVGGFFKDIFSIIINPEKAVARAGTFETTVRENKDNEELGVFFEDLSFNVNNKVFEEGRRIVGRARLKSESLLDTTTVMVSCNIKDYAATEPNIILSGSGITSSFIAVSGMQSLFDDTGRDYKEIKVFKGRPSINTVLCEYKEGIKLSDLGEGLFESEDRNLAALKFSMTAAYDFETDTFSRMYYMDKMALEEILLKGEDPFKKFNVKDPLISGDGTVKSENSAGPIHLFIASPDAQPFTDDSPYFLEVGIRSAGLRWKGDLRRLNKLEVHVPGEVVIDEDNCDLGRSGEGYSDDLGLFTIYTLKDEHLEKINEMCSETTEAGVFGDTCLDKIENEPNFLCQFTLQDAANIEPQFTYFRGRAEYVFETRTADVIKIVRK